MVKMKEAKDAEPIENKAEEQPKKKMVTRMKPVASSRLANSRSTKHLAAQAARALRNNREVVNSTTNRETRADSNKKGGANAPTFADDFTVESYDQSFDQTTMRDDESLSSEYTADSSEFNTRTFLSESFSSSTESTDSYDGEREDSSRMTTDNRGLSAEDDFDRELDGLVSELTRGMPSVVWEDQEAETEDDSLADKSKNKTHKQVIEEGKEKSYESNGVGDTGKLAGKEKAWMAYENKTANSSSVKDWPEDEQPLLASTNTSESEGMEYFKDARESHKEIPYQEILSIEKKSVETDVVSDDELRCDRPEAKEREIDRISCLLKQSPLLPEVAPTSQETKTAKKYKFYESDSGPVSPKRSHSKNKNKDTNITELEKSGDAVSVSSEDKSQKPTSPRKFSSHDKKAVERSPHGAQLDSFISKSNDRFPGVNVLSGIDLNADKLSMKSEIMVISEIDSSSPTKRPYSMAPLQRTPPEIKHTLDEMDMIYPVVASPIKLSHTFDVAPEGVLRFTSLSKQKRPPMIGSNETEEPPADNADLELELEKGSYSDDETHSQENRYPEYIIEKMKEPNEQLKGLIDVAINDQSGSRRMNACGAFKQLSGVNKRNALSLAWTQGVLVAHATVLKDLQASEQELNRTLTSLLSILRVPQNRRIVLATPFMAEGLTKCVNHVSPQIFVKAGHCIEALSHEKRNRPLLPRNTSMMQALCSRLHEYTTMDKTRKQTEETLKDMGLKDKSSFDPDKSAGIDTIAKSILNVFLELSKVLDVSVSRKFLNSSILCNVRTYLLEVTLLVFTFTS